MNYRKTAETLPRKAQTLSREYYIDTEILNEEFSKIFMNSWICVGRISEFTKKGKFKTVSVGKENIIILLDHENNLRAFYNVCRHRGTRICTKRSGTFSKVIQCGYHGWTYNIVGELVGAPHMNKVVGFKKKKHHLHRVAIHEWEGFIFINLNDNPENFNIFFKPIKNKFKQWNLSKLIPYKTKEYKVKGNWKLVVQNYCECYHCPVLHPDLASIHNYMSGRNDFFEGPFLGGYMNFNKDKTSINSKGELCCPPIKSVKKNDLGRVYYYSVFPNLLLSLHPEYVMYHTVWPYDVDKCIVQCAWLFEKEIIDSKKYQIIDAINFWDMTNNQDWYISELSQLGIQSKKYSPAPYSGQESLLAAYDNYYLEKMKFI